ncbi:MAG: hypothetical protein JO170_01120 [Verrucomicrobia bacterium]|nr:hypothetical protein [Verrucomicrobiota bacterium]
MKGFLLGATLVMAIQAVAAGGTFSSFSIVSPDRPRTWLVGGNDKLDQRLRWSDRKSALFLDVSFSLLFYTDQLHPTQYQTYTVSFPKVRLNAADQSLYFDDGHGHRTVLGNVRCGMFGQEVVLSPNVILCVERRDGVLDARLIVNGEGV